MDSVRTNHVTEAVKADMAQLSWVILGCGEMGTAIATALRASGASRSLWLVQRNPDKCKSLQKLGFNARESLEGLPKIDILIVAVKPRDIKAALSQARSHLSSHTWIISVAAGVNYQRLTEWVPTGQALFRIRPSIFVRQQQGNWLLAPNPNGYDDDFEKLALFLRATGNVFVLPELMMEQATWESSSIPAIIVPKILQLFVQAAPEAYQESAANMMRAGLESLLAYLKAQERRGTSPVEALGELCSNVVTPGGINDAAMRHLEQKDFWQTLRQAKDTYVTAEEKLKRSIS